MLLAFIDLTDKPDEDARTFECGECAYAETEIVLFVERGST
jgi:hypothetical protein